MNEPYGYVWFDKNMEQRFTRLPPNPESKDRPTGEVTPVYSARPEVGTIPCVSDDQLEKTYWDAYEAARDDGIGEDPHLLGLRAIVEACSVPSPLRQKSDG